MTNKTKISLGAVTVLFLAIAGSVAAAQQTCTTPEAQMIREAVQTGNPQDPAIQAKLAGLPALEKVEAKICALQNLTPDESAKIVAQKEAMAGPTISTVPGEATPTLTLGIQGPIEQDILGKSLIHGTNTWKGNIEGQLTTVTGTAEANNPAQGVLFVWEPGQTESNIGNSKTYLAPTATGPLQIISEANGVLTLESVGGTYEAYDAATNALHDVTTEGGTTYTFDIASRSFK